MRFSLPIIALAAIAAPAAATPQSGDVTVPVRIAFADIDVTSNEGRAVLEQRIETKIEAACTVERNSRYSFGRDVVDQTCVKNARAEAFAAVERVAAAKSRGGREIAAN
ncbi:UrcA family protein [Erythrobacter sp. MTPC3]|uniref:UrcA family protein n=1 Tax=Erythrobacter sp. MTPC3 TaxID=3056564 RepID=UPI0036F44C61